MDHCRFSFDLLCWGLEGHSTPVIAISDGHRMPSSDEASLRAVHLRTTNLLLPCYSMNPCCVTILNAKRMPCPDLKHCMPAGQRTTHSAAQAFAGRRQARAASPVAGGVRHTGCRPIASAAQDPPYQDMWKKRYLQSSKVCGIPKTLQHASGLLWGAAHQRLCQCNS